MPMKTSSGPARATGKPKPKATAGTSATTTRPRETTSRSKAPSAKVTSKADAAARPAAELIDERIRSLADWRGETLGRIRALIREAVPEITEEWKWGTPVWSRHGIVCTGEAYKSAVKLTFAHGASVPDPKRLFNSSLEGNVRRAIDVREGEKIDASAFKALVKAAVARNGQAKKK